MTLKEVDKRQMQSDYIKKIKVAINKTVMRKLCL